MTLKTFKLIGYIFVFLIISVGYVISKWPHLEWLWIIMGIILLIFIIGKYRLLYILRKNNIITLDEYNAEARLFKPPALLLILALNLCAMLLVNYFVPFETDRKNILSFLISVSIVALISLSFHILKSENSIDH